MTDIPFSQACENNKTFILPILQQAFNGINSVLEIGSGTGQHATFFAKHLPDTTWQTSDLLINHVGIKQWLNEYPATNLLPPLQLDLSKKWPVNTTPGVFTANTLHIVSWELVIAFFEGIKNHLQPQGKVCIYGPFNYQGKFTSDSNANFNLWLQERSELSGIRDYEKIIILATNVGLTLVEDHEMPANNRLLEFIK